jgi:hypothetical protein
MATSVEHVRTNTMEDRFQADEKSANSIIRKVHESDAFVR